MIRRRLLRRSLALALATAACSSEENLVPPDWGLNRMIRQPRYDPYEASPFFDDGRAMRLPPEDTVPVDAPAGPVATGLETASGSAGSAAVPLAAIPLPLTPALVARGRDRFNTFCAPCHGATGDGHSVVAEAMPLVKPASLVSAELAARPPGHIFTVITHGFGMMPRYAYQLPPEDRWAVVAYVRALQLGAGVPLASLPEELRAAARKELER